MRFRQPVSMTPSVPRIILNYELPEKHRIKHIFVVTVAPHDGIAPLGARTSTGHYSDVIMTTMVSQFTSLTVVYSIVYSDADQRKHQSSASLAFVWGIHRGPVNSPHKGSVTRKMFPFDESSCAVMMIYIYIKSHPLNFHNVLSIHTQILNERFW